MQYSEEIHQMFIGGVDYQYQDGSILFYSLINGERGDILKTNKREGAENIGVFLQDEILFGEQISLIIGARYDNISYFTDIYVDGALPVYKNEMKSFERVTPKAGITWKLQNDMSIYANLGGGIEVPAGNETDPPTSLSSYIINPLLQPIQSLSLEAGYKCDLIHDNFLLLGKAKIKGDLAIYTISTENDIVPYSGGRFYFSAGKTKRTGIECSHSARWENGLTISASFTLSSNVYTEYKQDSIVNGNPTGAAYKDYAQNSIAGIPNSYGSFKIQYTPISFSEFSCNAEIRNMSSYFANDANTLKVDAYSTIDIGIMYNVEISNNLELKVFGKMQNLLDIRYAAGVWINPDIPKFTTPAYLEPGLPRNIVIGTSLNWTN
jgi:iron complex outermembrane receptor protein